MKHAKRCLWILLGALLVKAASAEERTVELRWQRRDAAGRRVTEQAKLVPARTLVVVIDMWDRHWCKTYTARVANMVPRMNQTIAAARKLGIQVVWAPSDVAGFYKDHPQRTAMTAIPPHPEPGTVAFDPPAPPEGLDCCECGPDRPCKNASVWTRQHPGLEIADSDLIGDCNDARELFNLCAERDLDTILYLGVASNMCVCHRSFGLLNAKRHGFRVLFVRDLVEAITANGLDPATKKPDWNFTPAKGSARTERYLEQHVAPSIESRQLIAAAGTSPNAGDPRPHIVFVMADDEYQSGQTLPAFAKEQLEKDFRCTFCFAKGNDPTNRNDVSGLAALYDADLLVLSMRRRALPVTQMDFLERYLRAGKPLVALRVCTVPFQVEPNQRPDGHVIWRDFDQEVLGCQYRGYRPEARQTGTDVWAVAEAGNHPVLRGLNDARFHSPMWIYRVNPLARTTEVLVRGRWSDQDPEEPVAWTNSKDGSRVFYTGLGHPDDFAIPAFRRLLLNAVHWAVKPDAGPVGFTAPIPANFQVRPLPGHAAFVFTMYGVPAELESLQQLVQVMRDHQLGNGFDPGPTPHTNAKPLFDYLAGVGWPVICYPGCADMQIKGGRCVLGPESEAALAALDRALIFTAVQLGEWGYYFHNLSPNEPWWRDVYGKEFDQLKHLMKPPGLAGYDRRPTSRRECCEVLRDYFTSRSRDLLGRVISVTGHSHYEAYAGEWGARCIGLEVGENIAFTQSKLAFARGASRQWQLPWSVQVSPWFSGACTTSGPLRKEGGGARGLDAGHSLSFYERMWLHAWFAGAAMVTPENSLAIFFEKAATPWTLTAHGRKAAEVFQFMQAHERGVPFTPVAIVLDHLAGYNAYLDRPWGILEPTAGDRQVRDLFDHQLFPGSDHIHHRPDPDDPESSYLRPTPYGEMFDVQLTSASAEMLASYSVILLAGDIDFDDGLTAKLERALKQGSTLLLAPAHREALGPRFDHLAKHPGVEWLQPWTNPATGRSAAISDLRLQRLARETLPVEIAGDPVQYQVNRTTRGWVVELINNAGVAKKPDQPATADPRAIARVVLKPRIRCASAREWQSHRSYSRPDELRLEVGPGQSAFVELICPAAR